MDISGENEACRHLRGLSTVSSYFPGRFVHQLCEAAGNNSDKSIPPAAAPLLQSKHHQAPVYHHANWI